MKDAAEFITFAEEVFDGREVAEPPLGRQRRWGNSSCGDDLPTIDELTGFLTVGGILIAVDDRDRPAAYLLVERL